MQTHDDFSHDPRMFERNPSKPQFMKDLRGRAAEMTEAQASAITAGLPNEFPLAEWRAENGVAVKQLHPDPQDILRISVGGLIQAGQYCVFRGDRAKCIHVLQLALAALQAGPKNNQGAERGE